MKKLFSAFILILLALSLLSCTIVNEVEAGEKAASKIMPSVLELTCTFQASVSHATGFIVDERGYVMTNAHVVTSSVDGFVYEATEIVGNFNRSEQQYTLGIISFDLEKDLALLKFSRNDLALTAAPVAESDNLKYGSTIFTLGNAEGYGISMTKGIISVPKRSFKDTQTGIVSEVIQIDAAVNNGSSGGPLINVEGNVIGMISFKIKKQESKIEGIGFAIPSKVFMAYFNDAFKTPAEQSIPNEAAA